MIAAMMFMRFHLEPGDAGELCGAA